MNKNKRFVWEKQQTGLLKQISIIIDAETGVIRGLSLDQIASLATLDV